MGQAKIIVSSLLFFGSWIRGSSPSSTCGNQAASPHIRSPLQAAVPLSPMLGGPGLRKTGPTSHEGPWVKRRSSFHPFCFLVLGSVGRARRQHAATRPRHLTSGRRFRRLYHYPPCSGDRGCGRRDQPHMRVHGSSEDHRFIPFVFWFLDPWVEPVVNMRQPGRVTSHPVAASGGCTIIPHARGTGAAEDGTNLT